MSITENRLGVSKHARTFGTAIERALTHVILWGCIVDKSSLFLQSILADDQFIETVRTATYSIDYPENAEAHLNEDIDPDKLLYTVLFVRKVIGKKVGAVTSNVLSRVENAERGYCVVTSEIEEKLEAILEKARTEPYASRNLANHIHIDFFSSSVIEDLVAASARDGLDLDHDTIRLLLNSRKPCNAQENLVLSACDIVSQHFTAEDQREALGDPLSLFSELQTSEELDYRPIRRPPNVYATEINRDDLRPQYLFNLGNTKTVDSLLKCIEASDCIWEVLPFPRWNGLMEWILRMLYSHTLGLPLLRYVPLSRIMLQWEHGLVGPPRAMFPFGKGTRENEFGIDSSPYFLQILSFLEADLNRLLDRIESRKKRVDDLNERLSGTPWLNHRHTSLLHGWLECERGGLIDVSKYAQQFSVSPNTARQDLRILASLGLCSVRRERKREIYTQSSNLLDMLEISLGDARDRPRLP